MSTINDGIPELFETPIDQILAMVSAHRLEIEKLNCEIRRRRDLILKQAEDLGRYVECSPKSNFSGPFVPRVKLHERVPREKILEMIKEFLGGNTTPMTIREISDGLRDKLPGYKDPYSIVSHVMRINESKFDMPRRGKYANRGMT